jgi:DNA-binding helix-hairpin-helix protein with protein kinase domain
MTNPTRPATRQVWASRPAPNPQTPALLVPVTLGDALNAGAFGGTATVHRMHSPSYLYMVAKVFKDEVLASRRSPAMVAKLMFIAVASDSLKRGYVGNGFVAPARPHVAWPEVLLYDADSTDPQHLIGFAMPLFADSHPLAKLTSPKQRKATFSRLPTDGLLCAAQNIAGAIADLHGADGRSGIILGDLTPRNIMIRTDLHCQLIDADSYQYQTGARLFGSADTTPGFRSPRMAEAARAGGALPTFTHADDAYCLALVLFHVLVDGAHPWIAGERFEVGGIKPDEEDNMLAGRFPYADAASYHPPKIRLQTYQRLHPVLRQNFEQAFLRADPPPPSAWFASLARARQSSKGPISSGWHPVTHATAASP